MTKKVLIINNESSPELGVINLLKESADFFAIQIIDSHYVLELLRYNEFDCFILNELNLDQLRKVKHSSPKIKIISLASGSFKVSDEPALLDGIVFLDRDVSYRVLVSHIS